MAAVGSVDSETSLLKNASEEVSLFLTAEVCPEFEVRLLNKEKLPREIAACLFRIDPYFSIDPWSEGEMTELMRQAYKDMQKDKNGTSVTFGSKVILKHFLSNKTVRLRSEKIGEVIESWPLCLDSTIDSASIIVVEQTSKSISEDSPVDITKPIALRFTLHASASRLTCYNRQVVAGEKFTKWHVHPYKSILSSNEQLTIGVPFCLKLKTMNFYLACDGSLVKYADLYSTGALWTIVAKDITSGGDVKSQGEYYLRSIETGLFMGTPGDYWQLVPDISDESLITFLSLSEDADVIDYEDYVKIATPDGKMLGVSKNTLDRACLATVNPSAYRSHDIKYSEVAVDKKEQLERIGVFQIVRFEDDPRQLLLYSSYAIAFQRHQDSLRGVFANFNSNPTDPAELSSALSQISNLCSALKESYHLSGSKDRAIFITLHIPTLLADLFVIFNEMKETLSAEQEEMTIQLDKVYDNLSELLIQMMETDLLAREQVKSREGQIINYVNSESRHVPVIFKMSHDRLEKGINPRDWIDAIRNWLPSMEDVTADNAVFQDLVLSILSGALLTLGQTNVNIQDIIEVFKEKSETQIFRFKFKVQNGKAFANLLSSTTALENHTSLSFTEGEDVFIAMCEIWEDKGWPSSFVGYTAMLIDFYTSCFSVLGKAEFSALFPNLGLTPEVLFLLCSESRCRFRIRTASFKLLSKMLTIEQSQSQVQFYDEQDILSFATRYESTPKDTRLFATNNGQLVLRYLAAKDSPQELSGAPLGRVLPFVASLMAFAATIIESHTETELFQDAIQRCVLWALSGIFNPDLKQYTGNWLAVILTQGIREGPHMVQKVNVVLENLFTLLLATTRTITEIMGKLTLAKFSNIHNRGVNAISTMATSNVYSELERILGIILQKRSTADRTELSQVPPLTLLRETLYQSLIAANNLQFTVTDEVLEMYLRVFAPVSATLFELKSIVYSKFPIDYLKKFREEIKRKTYEADVISRLDVTNSPDELFEDYRNEYKEIINQIRAIERSPIKHFVKIIIWEEKIKYYLLLWDRIYGQINKGGNSDETNIELYRLSSALFAMFRLLLENNPKRVKEFLSMFKPFLYYLDLVDEAWLINEFSNYQNITPRQMITFVDILKSRFYEESVLKSGAFQWVEAMVVNSDGSLKKDLQSAAYLSLSTVLPEVASELSIGSSGSFAQCLKMMSLCAYRNQSVQSLLRVRVPMKTLKEFLEKSEEPDMADAVLMVVARVHCGRSSAVAEVGSQSLAVDILVKVLEIAQRVFKADDFQKVLLEGFYDQVTSDLHVNIHGHYYSPEIYKTVSLLRLISSGMLPPGGITGSIATILRTFVANSISQESDRFKKIALEYKSFLLDFKGFLADCEKIMRKSCNFSIVFACLDKCLKSIDHILRIEKAKKEEDSFVIEVHPSAVPTEATLIPRDEDVLLTKPVEAFVAALSKVQSWKEVYVANIANTVKRIIMREKPSISTFVTAMEGIVTFFHSREKYMFPVMKLVIGVFDKGHLAACNKRMMKLIVNRLLNSKNFDEICMTVEFYEAFGDLKDQKRYKELLEVLETRNSGSKLLAKIKRAFVVETRIREVLADSTTHRPKSITAALRKAKTRRFIAYSAFDRVARQHNETVRSYIGLLESWCDNSNTPMQKWVATQGTPIDVNIVSEVLNFTTSLLDLGLHRKSFKQNEQLIMESLDCLCEFVSGPCIGNQRTVGESVKLFMIIGEIMKLPFDESFSSAVPDEFIDIRSNAFWVLAALLEGSPAEDLLDVYYRFFNEIPVIKYISLSYRNLIKPKISDLELDNNVSPEHKKIVQFTMGAVAILVRFCSLSDTPLLSMLSGVEMRQAFIEFFSRYIGYVEIFQEKNPGDKPSDLECIHGIWFIIPFKCKFLTDQSASDLIVNVNHSSQQDKLADFLNLVEPFEGEMIHQRELRKKAGLKAFTMLWNRYQDLATLLVLVITLYILFTFKSVRNTDFSLEADIIIIQILGIIQVLLYLLGYVAYVIEQYARIVNKYKSFLPSIEMMEFATEDHHESISSKYVDLLKDIPEPPKNAMKCVNLMTDYQTVKTLIYVGASIIALIFPLFFPFLLLELAESKPEVRNVFRSVTQNWSQLVITAILGIILVYIFSVFAYVYFNDYYSFDNGVKSDSLYDCFMSTLNLGIRNGGGIAEALSPPDYEGANSASDTGYNYWGLLVFDICFFVIIIILMLNLVFGIIISTFGELREGRNDLYADINNKCYICGLDRSQIELYGEGWQYHFQIEHSPFAYLAFLILIRELERNKEEMTGIQNYVLKKFNSADSTFLPASSRLIAGKAGDKKE